jgi:23S rRNA (pseudouridine1915-N3)-methyltransferase
MQLNILAVGKRMPDWVTAATTEYKKRFPNQFALSLIEVNTPKRSKTSLIPTLMSKEGEDLLNHINQGDYVVILDEHGQSWSTKQLAQKMQLWHDENLTVCFIIGGPDGLADNIRQRAQQSWSLGKLIYPHPLVRVILVEQLYRAISIINNHPYHRD